MYLIRYFLSVYKEMRGLNKMCDVAVIGAGTECTNPQMTVTSTVKCSDGPGFSVRTDTTIPEDKIFYV